MEGLFESITLVPIILFVVGMVFIMIELFVPGFGIFGGLGLAALILCIVFLAKTVLQGMILFLILAAIVTVIVLIFLRSFKKGKLYRSSLVLKAFESKKEGYVSNDDYSHLAGKQGISLTTLRPAGIAQIDGEKADVVTDGEFIAKGSELKVVKVSGRRIIVKQTEA